MKKREAYLRYTTLYCRCSTKEHCSFLAVSHSCSTTSHVRPLFLPRLPTFLSARRMHFRTISPSSARFCSVVSPCLQYLASLVCPCLFTINKKCTVMVARPHRTMSMETSPTRPYPSHRLLLRKYRYHAHVSRDLEGRHRWDGRSVGSRPWAGSIPSVQNIAIFDEIAIGEDRGVDRRVVEPTTRGRCGAMAMAMAPRLRRVEFVEAQQMAPTALDMAQKHNAVVLGATKEAQAKEMAGTNRRRSDGNGRTSEGTAAKDDAETSSIRFEWTDIAQVRVGSGLQNLGNSCYMNAVLQCLTHTPALAQWCLEGRHARARCAAAAHGAFCALCAFERHVGMAMQAKKRTVSPTTFARGLRQLSRGFRVGRQEDAHEFARCLTEAMRKSSIRKGVSKRTAIDCMFGGKLRSQVKCAACSHCSDTFDPCLDISLDIQRAASIEKAFMRFTETDVLDGDNKYRCDACGKRSRATKRFTVDVAPQVLVLHLKRFAWSGGGMGSGKIEKWVEYPLSFDLGSFMSIPTKNRHLYNLFAVLVHSGRSTHSGHYYAFVKGPNGMWYEMDDCSVRQVSESAVLRQKAYMLFYNQKRKDVSRQNSGPASPPAADERAESHKRAQRTALPSSDIQNGASNVTKGEPDYGSMAQGGSELPRESKVRREFEELLPSRNVSMENGSVPRLQDVMKETTPSLEDPTNTEETPKKKRKDSMLSKLRPVSPHSKHVLSCGTRKAHVMRAALHRLSEKKQAPHASPARQNAAKQESPHRGRVSEASMADEKVSNDSPGSSRPSGPHHDDVCARLVPNVATWENADVATVRKAAALMAASTPKEKERDWWDIEYDRGKTKKVREKREPDHQDPGDVGKENPFQQHLSERSKKRRGGDEGKGKTSKRVATSRRPPPRKRRRE